MATKLDKCYLNEDVKTLDTPLWTFLRLQQVSGSTTVAFAATAPRAVQWLIPGNCVINWSKSYMVGQFNSPNTNALTVTSCIPFGFLTSIDLSTRSGVNLGGVSTGMQQYQKMVVPRQTKFTEMVTRSTSQGQNCAGNANIPQGTIVLNPHIYTPITQATAAPSSTPILEQQYAETGEAKQHVTYFNHSFSDIKNTIFSLDKSIPMIQPCILTTTFAGYDTFHWFPTALADPSTGGATDAITLTNCEILLCVDVNPETTVKMLNDVAVNGFAMSLPVVLPNQNAIANAAFETASTIVDSSTTKNIRRIYHGVFNNTATQFAPAVDNWNGALYGAGNVNNALQKIASYWTQLNSQREQPFNLTTSTMATGAPIAVTTGTDYLWMHHLLKGSCILNHGIHNSNLCHISDYVNGDIDTLGPDVGKRLLGSAKFDYCCNTTAAIAVAHWTFVIGTRKLSMKGSMIDVSA